MNVLDAMQARRSVRRYLPKPVEEEKLEKVLEAVRLTPSRHNEQNIRVIVVQDAQRKHALRIQANTQEMVEQAGAVLVLCATDQTDFVMPCGQYGYVVDMSLATPNKGWTPASSARLRKAPSKRCWRSRTTSGWSPWSYWDMGTIPLPARRKSPWNRSFPGSGFDMAVPDCASVL